MREIAIGGMMIMIGIYLPQTCVDAVHACVVEEYIIDGDGDDDCANSSH